MFNKHVFNFQEGEDIIGALRVNSSRFLKLLPDNSNDRKFKWMKDGDEEIIVKMCELSPVLLKTQFEIKFFEIVSGFIGTIFQFQKGFHEYFGDGTLIKRALVELSLILEPRVKSLVMEDYDGDCPVSNILKLRYVITHDPNFAEVYEKNKFYQLLEICKEQVQHLSIGFVGHVSAQKLLFMKYVKEDCTKPNWFFN
jgi:hypothetical protein